MAPQNGIYFLDVVLLSYQHAYKFINDPSNPMVLQMKNFLMQHQQWQPVNKWNLVVVWGMQQLLANIQVFCHHHDHIDIAVGTE